MIYARSLASVVALADQPTQDRQQQTVQEPLVLYIARVPGSRDIFLTTMKPNDKVVTAQDIENSLYYVHVDDAMADRFRLSDELKVNGMSRELFWDSVDEHHRNYPSQPKRKPVPNDSRSFKRDAVDSQSPRASPGFVPEARDFDLDSQPTTRRVEAISSSSARAVDVHPASSLREILGPRPMPDCHSVDNSKLRNAPQRRNVDMRRWSEQPLPTNLVSVAQTFGSDRSQRLDSAVVTVSNLVQGQEHSSSSYEIARHNEGYGATAQETRARTLDKDRYSLTLIRRYNGLQSNVGKILMRQEKVEPHIDDILVEVSTYGYRKFKDQECSRFEFAHRKKTMTPKDQVIEGLPVHQDDGFRCHVRKVSSEGRSGQGCKTKSADFHPHVQSSNGAQPSSRRRMGQNPGEFYPADSREGSSSEHTRQQSKGFTFVSPWNDVCEFSTDLTGRKLRCRHRSRPVGQAVAVSELRFNLPGSKAIGSPTSKSQFSVTSMHPTPSSSFTSEGHQRHWSEHHVRNLGRLPEGEMEQHLDLSLGLERAGGGFWGKQAKLGKLVIESEGIQMLDLVVATNIGMYFKVYDALT